MQFLGDGSTVSILKVACKCATSEIVRTQTEKSILLLQLIFFFCFLMIEAVWWELHIEVIEQTVVVNIFHLFYYNSKI